MVNHASARVYYCVAFVPPPATPADLSPLPHHAPPRNGRRRTGPNHMSCVRA